MLRRRILAPSVANIGLIFRNRATMPEQRGPCMAALHNKCFPSGQKRGIVHPADAHGGFFPPSAAAAAVPLWRFFEPSHFMGRATRRPIFFDLIVPSHQRSPAPEPAYRGVMRRSPFLPSGCGVASRPRIKCAQHGHPRRQASQDGLLPCCLYGCDQAGHPSPARRSTSMRWYPFLLHFQSSVSEVAAITTPMRRPEDRAPGGGARSTHPNGLEQSASLC